MTDQANVHIRIFKANLNLFADLFNSVMSLVSSRDTSWRSSILLPVRDEGEKEETIIVIAADLYALLCLIKVQFVHHLIAMRIRKNSDDVRTTQMFCKSIISWLLLVC